MLTTTCSSYNEVVLRVDRREGRPLVGAGHLRADATHNTEQSVSKHTPQQPTISVHVTLTATSVCSKECKSSDMLHHTIVSFIRACNSFDKKAGIYSDPLTLLTYILLLIYYLWQLVLLIEGLLSHNIS